MSIKDRIADARKLYCSESYDGALLATLVAVAATSRRRYPPPPKGKRPRSFIETDRGAFEQFIRDEFDHVTSGFGGTVESVLRGKKMRLEGILYEYLRCQLMHEAKLPPEVKFERGTPGYFSWKADANGITVSHSLLNGLARAVEYAPENADLFPAKPELSYRRGKHAWKNITVTGALTMREPVSSALRAAVMSVDLLTNSREVRGDTKRA